MKRRVTDRPTPTAARVSLTLSISSFLLVIAMASFLLSSILEYRTISLTVTSLHLNSPHYRTGDEAGAKCNECHAYPDGMDCGKKHGKADCLSCHKNDGKAKRLKYASILVLCTRCHAPEVFISYEDENGVRKEVDVSHNHPYNQTMTSETFPHSLPLNEYGGMTCVTCHDVHMADPAMKMLRIFHPANGTPEDVKPLCHDCHHSNGVL